MKCGKCGGDALERSEIRHEAKVDGARFVGSLPGTMCAGCKETWIALDDLIRFEHAVATELATHGPVNGATLRYMRKSIPLAATALAELLRVAPQTVSRWETGECPVDRAAWLVVRQLLLAPGSRQEIENLADEPSAQPVPIAVRFGG